MLTNNVGSDGRLVRHSVSFLGALAVAFPLFGVLFSIIWSILYNFDASVRTHCHVANYLPTISSAIGGYTPQRYVWRICVALHVGVRFLLANCYYSWYQQYLVPSRGQLFMKLLQVAITCHVIENLALVTLTCISSTENGDVHEYSFIVFMVCSILYMMITCSLMTWSQKYRGQKVTLKERKNLRQKLFLFLFNFMSFLVSIYLYLRHNQYCEPGVYTWFAVAEYLTVFSNIAFHGMCVEDFRDYSVTVLASSLLQAPPFKQH